MSSGQPPFWEPLITKIFTGKSWIPFLRITAFILLLGTITAVILLILGPYFATAFATTGIAAGAKKAISRRKIRNA